FYDKLLGNCGDGQDIGENCSVLPCKEGLHCTNIDGRPTCV
ncbi:7523_t:CDS:1, partial [Scutellospora calospora]